MAHVDSMFIFINSTVFDLIVKEALKKEKEDIGEFIYKSIPRMKEMATLQKVTKNVQNVFKQEVCN